MKKTLCLILVSMLGASAFGSMLVQIISTHNGPAVVINGVTYYLPAYAVTEPTTNYPAGFAAFGFAPNTTNVSALAPQISEWTRQAQPGDTIALTAENLDPTNALFVFSDDGSEVLAGDILVLDDRQCAVTLPDGLSSNAFYLAWPYNSDGFGEPVGINQADLWWCNSSVATGSMFRVFGQNLELDGTSHLYIKELDTWLSTTNCDPYMAEFTLPASAVAGTYTVYAHNGHGGKYGWSGPLSISVWNGYQFSEDPNTWFDVTDYGLVGDGVTDNGAAFRAMWASIRNNAWPTMYFPAGNYLIAGTVNNPISGGISQGLRITGDGKDLTTISCATYGYDLKSIELSKPKSIVSNLTIKKLDTNLGQYSLASLITGNDTLVDSVRFDARGVSGTETTRATTNAKSNHIVFNNCEFIDNTSLYIENYDIVFNDCDFRGLWDNNGMVYMNSEGVAFVDCSVSPYDISSSLSGEGWAKGRWLVSHKSMANVYVGDCIGTNLHPRIAAPRYTGTPSEPVNVDSNIVVFADLTDLGVDIDTLVLKVVSGALARRKLWPTAIDYETGIVTLNATWRSQSSTPPTTNDVMTLSDDVDVNSGEIILWEAGHAMFRANPISFTSNTVTFSSLSISTTPWNSIGREVVVVGGKGLGQSRIIGGVNTSTGVVTLKSNWKIQPDETSTLVIGAFAANWAITRNDFHAGVSELGASDSASVGVQFSNGGGSQNAMIKGNTFRDIDRGVALDIYSTSDFNANTNTVSPWYFGQISNNTFLDSLYGFHDLSRKGSSTKPDFPDALLLGLLVRNNVFKGTKTSVFNSAQTYATDARYLAIWDRNLVTNLVGVLDTSDHARNNDVWINNTFYGSGNGLRLFSNPVALQGNTFTGFSTNYTGTLPGAVLQIPQGTVPLANASETVTLYNVGTTELTYTATDNAAWLSVTDSGSISAESSGDMVLSRSGSTTNGATALVSVVAAGQTNVFTVIYGDELGTP